MKLYIKNMVCNRCKMVVKSELEKLGLHLITVELGEVEMEGNLSEDLKKQLSQRLSALGFELIDSKKRYWSFMSIVDLQGRGGLDFINGLCVDFHGYVSFGN